MENRSNKILYAMVGITMLTSIFTCVNTQRVAGRFEAFRNPRTENIVGNKAPDTFYQTRNGPAYLKVDEMPVKAYVDSVENGKFDWLMLELPAY